MEYVKNPQKIEEQSFEIIQRIIEEKRPDYSFQSPLEEAVIKRAIHTSADFDYLDNLQFTNGVLAEIQKLILNGGHIFTDTTMALSGMNKKILDQWHVTYACYIGHPEIAKAAKKKGITRSMAAIEYAAKIPGPKLFVVGNAPTAIYKILEMVAANELEVTALVGAPVGFVGAAESKEKLFNSGLPAVVARGRKGGSNIAAAIVNALLYHLPEEF